MEVNWWKTGINLVADIIDRVPLEKILIPQRDTRQDQKELLEIYKQSPITQTAVPPKPQPATRNISSDESDSSNPTTEETLDYENHNIALDLIALEKHYVDKLTILGKRCDCGSGRHLLGIESSCKQAISMADDPDIYYRLLEWVKKCTPRSTSEAAKSGIYDNDYPEMAKEARAFRKEIIGSLDVEALLSPKQTKQLNKKQALELPEGKTEGTPAELIPEVLNPEDERKELLARGVVI